MKGRESNNVVSSQDDEMCYQIKNNSKTFYAASAYVNDNFLYYRYYWRKVTPIIIYSSSIIK